MPIYEYECGDCGRKFELRQCVGEDGTNLACPDCGTIGPRRLFSSFFSSGSGDMSDMMSSYGGGGSSCSTCSSGNCASCGM
ncbi:MAG: zinc ribbon domain-containing protein [Dehalococcoidia bacterium]|nr:zinc ribbon domain-containing protein [Dehalococcoidia bacterium]